MGIERVSSSNNTIVEDGDGGDCAFDKEFQCAAVTEEEEEWQYLGEQPDESESVPKVFSNPTWNREFGNSILEDEGDF